MSPRLLRVLIERLRVFALVWLVLGLAAQPVLAKLADIHHAVHDLAASQAGQGHPHDHDHAAEDGPLSGVHGEPDEPSTLHDVLHLAHCCAQATVPATQALALPAVAPAGTSPAPAAAAMRRESRCNVPYRPPIRA